MSDGWQFAATHCVALTNSTVLVRPPPNLISNAHLPTGIFPCRLTVLSSVTMAYYYQATRCHSPEYGKIENPYLCCMDGYCSCFLGWVLIRKETSYSYETRDLFNILPSKLNTFLARWSNFCKPLKKIIQNAVRPTRSPRHEQIPRRTKNGELPIFSFSPRNRW